MVQEESVMLPIHTILHPTDFSAGSAEAFHLACALARDYGARLIVLHVMERPLLIYSGVMAAPPPPEISAEERQALREKLQQLHAEPTLDIEHLLVEGDPTTAILRFSGDRHCDLIVMGSHGRRGIGRLLLGSVAEQVLRQATCPVLTVKVPVPPIAARPARPARELAKT